MPRRKKGFVPAPKPYEAKDIVSTKVYQPLEMNEVFQNLAQDRGKEEKVRVPIRHLYDEAIQELLTAFRENKPIFFSPTPTAGAVRRTIWMYPDTMTNLKEVARSRNFQLSQLVLTALIQYMARRGVTFECFPAGPDQAS
jgi:hypothetical protein